MSTSLAPCLANALSTRQCVDCIRPRPLKWKAKEERTEDWRLYLPVFVLDYLGPRRRLRETQRRTSKENSLHYCLEEGFRGLSPQNFELSMSFTLSQL